MTQTSVDELVARALSEHAGFLRLDPAWVAREWLPSGRRLPVPDGRYDLGDRGEICERWLASVTPADNRVGPPDEGLSHLRLDSGERVRLDRAVASAPGQILGEDYARRFGGLRRLAKIFDYAARIPFHIHPPADQAALVGRSSKDEAYYFPPGQQMGPHPETFLGLHPGLMDDPGRDEAVLGHLRAWRDDRVLSLSSAYLQVEEEGFSVPSGLLHAPGTAVTIELQEDADTLSMFQALNAGEIISKELLYKDVSPHDREELGERALLRWIDWSANCDPNLYEKRVIAPLPVNGAQAEGAELSWIFRGSDKFSGLLLRLRPGRSYQFIADGVYSLFVWSGTGSVAGLPMQGGHPEADELLVTHQAATTTHEFVNVGTDDLVVVMFFGPGINTRVPPAGRRPLAQAD